jgi:hypothetical protein
VFVFDFNIMMNDEKYYRIVLCVVKDDCELILRHEL